MVKFATVKDRWQVNENGVKYSFADWTLQYSKVQTQEQCKRRILAVITLYAIENKKELSLY
jgi:hypothetical protein